MYDSEKNKSRILVPNDYSMLKPYCSVESIEYLKLSLKRLEKGSDPTISFPLYGKREDSNVTNFMDILGKLNLPDWLQKYEESRLAKVGPQGGTPKWSDLQELFKLYKTAVKDVKYVDPDIISEMKRDYSKLNCNMKSAKEALEHLKRTDKIETRAAGWSEFQLKKTDPRAQQLAIQFAQNGLWKHGVGYTFARYNKKKLRIFMPMPFSSMIKQAQYFVPFLGGIQLDLLQSKHRSPYVVWADKVGFSKCFSYMESEIKEAKLADDEYLIYFSNDFEKMDTRTGSSQYEHFFIPMLEAAFHRKSTELSESMLFTTTAPIFSPGGMITGNHGTASGAEVTNGGETTGNDYFQRRFLKILRQHLNNNWRILSRRANGDDSALVFALKKSLSKEVFKDNLMKALKEACDETGWDIQFDKLDISDEYGKYCQNVYYYDRKDGKLMWMYPTILTLNSIVNPEKQYRPKDWDKDYRDLDIIQKLDNSFSHPAYHELIDYVMKGMKYPLLGQSETETRRILSKYESYRAQQSLGERYNRQDYDIDESPTVKYILSKR